MEINAKKLAQEIDKEFKNMRFHPMIEESRFAFFEASGIQVQVILTKDDLEHCAEIITGIANV